MKASPALLAPIVAAMCALLPPLNASAQDIESMPPVVVKTVPEAGARDVSPGETEIKVTFSKAMTDQSWSWSSAWENSTPLTLGQPRFDASRLTCVLKVTLEPNTTYAYWLNSEKFKNFKDANGRPAVPYLLAFSTAGQADHRPIGTAPVDENLNALLNDDQKAVVAWTDRQFRSFFDNRTFDGWSDEERAALETKCLDALRGPRSREFYTAINTLGAMRSPEGLTRLRAIAFERVDKNNRDRWMAVRQLGRAGDRPSVPELIHLVYHGNQNTHWWAQIALVQLTRKNFGGDWEAWGNWWNESGGQPPYKPEIIRWWDGQAETIDGLKNTLAEGDRKFLDGLR